MLALCKRWNILGAAAIVALFTVEFSLADGPVRSGVQKVLGGRGSSQNRTQNGAPTKRILDRNQGGFINRYFPENSSARRTARSGSALPPNFSKSQIMAKYGAATGGNWTSVGQNAPPQTAKQADVAETSGNTTPSKTTTPTVVAIPMSPSAPAQNAQTSQTNPPGTAPVEASQSASASVGTDAGNVDLVLEDVKLVAPATDTTGPAYRIKLRNQGSRAAGKFRIGAFAERDDKLSDDTPHVVNEVAGLPGGKVSEVVMRLPLAAVRNLSTVAAEQMGFDHLLVIVDLDDAIVESEKSNNVADIKRVELEAEVK